MTTPQDPGGEPPQDPQNPYGTPAESTPQAPENPYGAPPPPPPTQPPPAAPEQPPYGQPPATGPAPYGAQPPGQPYGQAYPQYGAPAATQEAPKTMAVVALVLSFLGCTLVLAVVSIVLAVIVLVRGKDGRNHGKGLAIGAIVVSVISAVIGIILLAVGVFVSSLTDVGDLETGQCITADGLLDENATEVNAISVVSCSDDHDGEVITTTELTQEQADGFLTDESLAICGDAIEAAGKTDLFVEGGDYTYTSLAAPDPKQGDSVACVAYRADGKQLSASIG